MVALRLFKTYHNKLQKNALFPKFSGRHPNDWAHQIEKNFTKLPPNKRGSTKYTYKYVITVSSAQDNADLFFLQQWGLEFSCQMRMPHSTHRDGGTPSYPYSLLPHSARVANPNPGRVGGTNENFYARSRATKLPCNKDMSQHEPKYK